MKKCKSIIFIDDDNLENLVNTELIMKLNITEQIVTFQTVRLALNRLLELVEINEPPNMVFIDLNMAPMNGFQFLEEFNTLPSEFTQKIKVIVLTSSLNEEDYEKAQDIGCDGYLIKPLTEEAVKDELEKVFYYD